jgi:hypothetical protein
VTHYQLEPPFNTMTYWLTVSRNMTLTLKQLV